VLLLPSPLTATERNITHIHTTFWDEVREYVRNGGITYISLCADAAIPEMSELFGASLADHASVAGVSLTFAKQFGDIAPGTVFRYSADSANPRHWCAVLDVTDGEVIATDQDGRPALAAHSFGKGKTLVSTYPLESYLAIQPSVFEHAEETHRIYCGLMQWAGFVPLFATDVPGVEVAGLNGSGRGYAVLANHQPGSALVTVTSRSPLRSVAVIEADGKRAIPLNGSTWQMEVAGYDGAVIEWTL
jgi:beta-galactosidase